MRRREFLQVASLGGAAALVGTAAFGRMAYARHQLVGELTHRATPVLGRKAVSESQDLPAQARERIRTWFHGPCLNSAEFVDHVCSERFVEKLAACPRDEDKKLALVNAFVGMVVSEKEILDQVRSIAQLIGSVLDSNWKSSCDAISKEWEVHIQKIYREPYSQDLQSRIEPLIQSRISAACALSRSAAERPALSSTALKIGTSASAILLLPVVAKLTVPIFVVVALANLGAYVAGKINSRSREYREAISKHVARLADGVATEFETETKLRISTLHKWQEASLLETANAYAQEKVQLLN